MFVVKAVGLAVWEVALQMAPWLLFGFFAAGLMSLFVSPEIVSRFLGRAAGKKAVWLSVLLGVPLPLCSCGVLPLAVGLKRGGASKGAVAAFLISTPQTGLDSFFATGSLLGWCFAVVRPLVAALTGIVGGTLIQCVDTDARTVQPCAEEGGGTARKGLWKSVATVFAYGYGTLLKGVAPALLLGLFLSALITVFVPESFFDASFLGNDWIAFPVMLLIGMPMYVCSTASIPVALALMAKGISPGAALIFLIVGPALNGASLTMLLQILGKKCMAVYLLVIAVAALLSGMLLNGIDAQWSLLPTYTATCAGACSSGCAVTAGAKVACAVILFALLTWHLVVKCVVQKLRMRDGTSARTADVRRVTIKGMRCDHCRSVVKKCLASYPSVQEVTAAGPDAFEVRGTLPETLAEDIRRLGFEWVATE